MSERQFREDLYFRLSVFPIQIPPLRERGDDVLILARHFVDKFCKDLNKKLLMLSPTALDDLTAYSWPGNVRELQNCIERAVILADGDAIHQRHLNLSFRNAPTGQVQTDPWDQIDLSGTMTDAIRRVSGEVERRKIETALQEYGRQQGAGGARPPAGLQGPDAEDQGLRDSGSVGYPVSTASRAA